MSNQGSKQILVAVDDLMFAVKITDAAKRTGLQATFVKTAEDALTQASTSPLLIILDLNNRSIEPLGLIRDLKAGVDKSIPILAFVSHVQGELKQQAQDAGANVVLARSAFTQNLQQILKRHAGAF